jgi:hypothetical protein
MNSLSVSEHFSKLIDEIRHRITYNIDDTVYDIWMIKAKMDIVRKLKNEYEKIHAFHNNPDLFLPDIIATSKLEIYTIHFDRRLDAENLKTKIYDFIKVELGFQQFSLRLITDFFIINLKFEENGIKEKCKQKSIKLT